AGPITPSTLSTHTGAGTAWASPADSTSNMPSSMRRTAIPPGRDRSAQDRRGPPGGWLAAAMKAILRRAAWLPSPWMGEGASPWGSTPQHPAISGVTSAANSLLWPRSRRSGAFDALAVPSSFPAAPVEYRHPRLQPARVHRAGRRHAGRPAGRPPGPGDPAVPRGDRQRAGGNRRQLAGPPAGGGGDAAVLRRGGLLGAAAVPASLAVRQRPGGRHLRTDHARRGRPALRDPRLGDADPGHLHHDRRGTARRSTRQLLARAAAAIGRRGLVRRAVGAVGGAVRAPAGSAGPGAAVRGAGPVPEDQEQPARAAAPAGC